jgi:hypothetical protein
MNNNINQD